MKNWMDLSCGCETGNNCYCEEEEPTENCLKEIKNIFDSIIGLAVDGPDATSIRAVINKIIKEAGRGYNLCDCHLTSGTETKTRREGV